MSLKLLAFAFSALVLPLLLAEFGDWCPWLANRLIRWAARRLGDPAACMRYEEEMAADLQEIPGKLSRLVAAVWIVIRVPRMRTTLVRRDRLGLQTWAQNIAERIGKKAVELGLRPYWTTAIAALLSAATAVLVLAGYMRWAGLVFIVGCSFMILPSERPHLSRGALRETYIRQVVDRYIEFMLLGAIGLHYLDRHRAIALLSLVALVVGLITSFERAGATALRLERANGSLAAWYVSCS